MISFTITEQTVAKIPQLDISACLPFRSVANTPQSWLEIQTFLAIYVSMSESIRSFPAGILCKKREKERKNENWTSKGETGNVCHRDKLGRRWQSWTF